VVYSVARFVELRRRKEEEENPIWALFNPLGAGKEVER